MATSNPGVYPIVITRGSLSAQNYGFMPVNGSLTINRPPATFTFSPAALTFSSTGLDTASAPLTLTVNNVSANDAAVSSYLIQGANAGEFSLVAKTCSSLLPAHASCTLSMVFKPTIAGSASASLIATDTASGSPQSVSITGSAPPAATVAFSPSTGLTFPATSVGATSATQALNVTNASATSPMSVTSYKFSGANAEEFAIVGKTCGHTLAPGASCTLDIVFKPTATGAANASLVATDDAVGSPQSVPISGTGN